MTYLQTRHNPARERARRVLLATGIMVVAVAIIHFLRPHLFPALFTSVARPFWRTELAIKLGSLTSPEGLLQENELLKRQLSDEALRLATVRAVEMENAELKALLGRASTTPYVLSAVLKRPPVSPYDELVIDAGADHNFNLNDNVYAPGNVLIGRISEVLGQTSKVALFSSPGEKYEVLIGTSHAPATALGRGGGQYEADLPRDVKVSKGDFVIAPSRGDKPFGTVISVATDPAEPFEKILFAPPVNEYELRWVLVDNSTAL